MALTKLQFKPGIVKETTDYTQSGGWFDADKVRFRQGCPEKIGGWQAVVNTPFEGVCRYIHQWSDLESDRYITLGTSSHLYLLWSSNYYDITPLRTTITTGTDPFRTVHVNTTDLYVRIPGHGATVGDYVTFSGATTGLDVDANNNPVYTPADLNGQFRVTAVIDEETIMISLPTEKIDSNGNATGVTVNANATGGGGPVTAQFLIHSGLDDAVVGAGWGIPPWGGDVGASGTTGNVGWGDPFNITNLHPDATVNQIRLWDIDNFGQDLVANIRNGPIYYWHHSDDHTTRAVPLNQQFTDPSTGTVFTPSQVPNTAVQVIVSPNDRHLIAMGCEDINGTVADPLLVRWSDAENAYEWMPLRTNSAGSQRLSAGSYIICGMRTRQEILIWTDLGLWSMRYIGSPYIFGFDSIAEGLSILGPNSCINTGAYVYWMDRGIFYAYTGQIQELPCALKDYVFNDLNYLQAYKIYAGHNHAFSEVVWFYPSAASVENDRYVIYNYTDQTWTHGNLERTAWLNMGRDSYPVATDRVNNLLYYHELGDDANGAPLSSYIDSADIDAGSGDHYLYLSRFIPDVFFRGSADLCSQSVGVTIYCRRTPHEPRYVGARFTVEPMVGEKTNAEKFIRLRDRQVSFRFESDALGVGWRLGTVRADMQPDGRR